MDENHVSLGISPDEDFPAIQVTDKDIDWRELFVNLNSDSGVIQKCDKGYDSDSDDVVVIGEVLANPKRANKSSALVAQDDDDDCVVLDEDPDKPALQFPDQVSASGGDSDDLFIVAEKGQVACRDYPHPRHLCVKFPFDSTRHSDYCNLCHCYVCDSPAPCGNWGNGNVMIDHCHANEKAGLWTSERKRVKQEKSASVVTSPNNSFWRDLLNQIPAPAPPSAQNSVSLGQFPVQAPSVGLPNIIGSQSTAAVPGRLVSHYSLLSQQQTNPYSYNSQRARCTSLGYVTSASMFKRSGPVGRAAVPSRQGNNSTNNFRHAYANHLLGIRLASKQANGAVNLNTYQNSLARSASQISPVTMLSQGQVHQYSPLAATANNISYVDPNRNENGNISAPISYTALGNTSQSSQGFTGASHGQAGHSNYGMNPDFHKLEIGAQFLNDVAALDSEGGPQVFDMDDLWSLV